MSWVVFMRAVNVGGHQTFRPSQLAAKLADLRVASVGAAGTFVVRHAANVAQVRQAFARHLPFETDLMICPGSEVIDLVEADPFHRPPPGAHGQFITVVAKRPPKLPELPLYAPDRRAWQVAVIAVHGRSVATVTRKVERARLYPNPVVEKWLGVAATTRGWPTILKVRDALGRQS